MRKNRINSWILFACVVALFTICFTNRNRKEESIALYFAHIQVLDKSTMLPIEFDLQWDEDIYPNIKGAGPNIKEKHNDKTLSLAIVGRNMENGIGVKITADGYRSKVIVLRPIESGLAKPSSDNSQRILLSKF